jgi:hypothetical protein
MNNQSLLILAIGAFVALIVTVAAIDQYLLDEHPPTEVSGLIWRIENAFGRIKDLEAVLEITKARAPNEPIRMVVRYLSGPTPALSVRYLRPDNIKDERFVVQNDQLSHYLPQENLVVIKRWVGVPLAAIGLGNLDLSGLRDDWSSGRVRIAVVQDVPGFTQDLFRAPLALETSFSRIDDGATAFRSSFSAQGSPISFSFSHGTEERDAPYTTSWGRIATFGASGSIGGSYILEVRDARSNKLVRMIWVERDTFLIRKVVVFEDGQRSATLHVERIDLDQGLTEEEIITLPSRGVETIRG